MKKLRNSHLQRCFFCQNYKNKQQICCCFFKKKSTKWHKELFLVNLQKFFVLLFFLYQSETLFLTANVICTKTVQFVQYNPILVFIKQVVLFQDVKFPYFKTSKPISQRKESYSLGNRFFQCVVFGFFKTGEERGQQGRE